VDDVMGGRRGEYREELRSMHVDPQVEQMEITAGIVQVNSSVDLIRIRKDIRAVAFLESDQ
jgi:hypothetical protein